MQSCVVASHPVQTHPCDVEELWISSTDKKAYINQRVSATLPVSRDGGLTSAQRALLGEDDLLIQIVADRLRVDADRQSPDKRIVTFDGRTAPNCPHGVHSKILWEPDGAGSAGERKEWILSCPAPVEVLAKADQGTTNPAGFLQRFWTSASSFKKTYRVTIESCGVRSDRKQPTDWLTGRVEVVPNDQFELIWKVMKGGSYNWEKRGYTDITGADVTKNSQSSGGSVFGAKKASSSIHIVDQSKGDNYWETTESENTGKDPKTRTTKYTYGTIDGGQVPKRRPWARETDADLNGLAGQVLDKTAVRYVNSKQKVVHASLYQISVDISLKRNGVELDPARMVNSILSTVTKLKNGFKEFEESFRELVPKVGYFAKLDVSVMEGTLTGTWGNTTKMNPDHARIWLAEPQCGINGNLKVIDLTFEAGFGVESRIKGFFSSKPTLELVLKVSLVLSLEVPWEVSYSHARPKTLRSDLSADGTAVVQAVGRASLLGIVAAASADVSGGIKFSGAAECGLDRAPFIEGELKWKKIVVTVRAESPWTKPYSNEVLEWPKGEPRPIWQGRLPGDTAAPAGNGS